MSRTALTLFLLKALFVGLGVTFNIGESQCQHILSPRDPHVSSAGVGQRALAYPTPPPSNSSTEALLTSDPWKSKVVQEVKLLVCCTSVADALIFVLTDRICSKPTDICCVWIHQIEHRSLLPSPLRCIKTVFI